MADRIDGYTYAGGPDGGSGGRFAKGGNAAQGSSAPPRQVTVRAMEVSGSGKSKYPRITPQENCMP